MPEPNASPESAPPAAAPEGPEGLDLAAFQAAVSEGFVPLRVIAEHPDFRGSLQQVTVGDVRFSAVWADPQTVERTAELIRRSPRDYFKISLQLEGTSSLQQDERRVVLEPGDLAVYDTSRPYTLRFERPFRVMVVMLPHDRLDIPREVLSRATAVRLSGSAGLGRLVSPFLATLGSNIEAMRGPAGVQLAHNAVQLLETLFAHELDLAHAAADPHRALMQRIRDHIDEHLGDPQLGPRSIAAANFISTRHLHALFREQRQTVSGYVRSRRLEQCYLALSNPLLADTPIASIGLRWGFTDAAHFSRVFKAAYGESPTSVRARAVRNGGGAG